MDDALKVANSPFLFRLPVWTVAYTGFNKWSIAYVPTENRSLGESALGIFTDADQADRYLKEQTDPADRFRVIEVPDATAMELWLRVAEKLE